MARKHKTNTHVQKCRVVVLAGEALRTLKGWLVSLLHAAVRARGGANDLAHALGSEGVAQCSASQADYGLQ